MVESPSDWEEENLQESSFEGRRRQRKKNRGNSRRGEEKAKELHYMKCPNVEWS